jgi:hypothetical protein
VTTERNLAAVQRYADAWRSGDVARLVDCYHDEFTLHYGGANPFSGRHAGKPAALAVLAEVTRRTGRRLDAIIDVAAGPERAIVIARETFARGSETATVERVLVYAVKDDRLHQCWLFESDQATVDRFLRD